MLPARRPRDDGARAHRDACLRGGLRCDRAAGYAGALETAGCRVSVVARGATLEALRRDGLQLIKDGQSTVHSVVASDRAEDLGPQDYVFIAVKAQTLPGALRSVGRCSVPLRGWSPR